MLADLALRAVVAQEAIEATDDEVDAEIERLAERSSRSPRRCGAISNGEGVLEAVRSDIARGKALAFLVDHATVVDEDGNTVDLTFPEPAPAPRAAADEARSRRSTEAAEASSRREEPEA